MLDPFLFWYFARSTDWIRWREVQVIAPTLDGQLHYRSQTTMVDSLLFIFLFTYFSDQHLFHLAARGTSKYANMWWASYKSTRNGWPFPVFILREQRRLILSCWTIAQKLRFDLDAQILSDDAHACWFCSKHVMHTWCNRLPCGMLPFVRAFFLVCVKSARDLWYFISCNFFCGIGSRIVAVSECFVDSLLQCIMPLFHMLSSSTMFEF